MRVEIVLSARMQRRWHEDLVRRIGELPDTDVHVQLVGGSRTVGYRRLQRLLWLERRLHRLDQGGLARGALTATADGDDVDIRIDLTDDPCTSAWRVLYDDAPGEQAAVDALRAGRQPIVRVVDDAGMVRAEGRPGSELPGLMATALADLGAGVGTLVVGAIADRPFAAPLSDDSVRTPRSFGALAIRRVIGAAIRVAYRIGFRSPHWRVGWREVRSGEDALSLGALPSAGWSAIPDDGYHFYADPFPFEHEGRVHVFVEDWDHREQRAVISVFPWDGNGPDGEPRVVLTHDVHLSYPFVLASDGDIWMIPETSNARTVELFRAVEYPWRWERHSVLLRGDEVSDVSVFEHEGRWWMTGTVGLGGSLSDSLCLWSAPHLTGPWSPHAHNPVLVDIASARPAGRVERRDGKLLRPIQDGRRGYGASMVIAEITQLDDDGFSQRAVAELKPGDGWAGSRVHTLNNAGGVETIDGSRLVPRWRGGARRRLTLPGFGWLGAGDSQRRSE